MPRLGLLHGGSGEETDGLDEAVSIKSDTLERHAVVAQRYANLTQPATCLAQHLALCGRHHIPIAKPRLA
jgi:hypothetical protein